MTRDRITEMACGVTGLAAIVAGVFPFLVGFFIPAFYGILSMLDFIFQAEKNRIAAGDAARASIFLLGGAVAIAVGIALTNVAIRLERKRKR